MKKTLLPFLLLFNVCISFAQAPGVKWINYYYTLGFDNVSEALFDFKMTTDSGFVLVGSDTAYNYNKNEYLNKSVEGRPWLVKTDKDGNELWRFRSSDVDPTIPSAFTSVQVISGGAIIAVGYGSSFPQPTKYYIAKFDNNGNRLWYKLYGGTTGISKAYSVQETSDGGYIVAGVTTSNDGDVSGNHNPGNSDVWLLKLDGSGNIQWKKCFGGTQNDSAYAVIPTSDNGFVVAGSSTSSDGDLTANNGLSDAWLFKVNSSGTLVWQENIGGSGDEDFKSLTLNSDTSYTLIGYTSSSTITDHGNYGKKDFWVIKIKDAAGQILWSKNFGGTQNEEAYSIQRTVGNGYLVGGYTESADGDVTNNNGLADAWLLDLTSAGNLVWQKCVGTGKNDYGMATLYLSETDFVIAGFAEPLTPADAFDFSDGFLSRLGNINTIKGLLFNDANLNGIKDPSEGVFNEALVTTTKSGFQRAAVPQNGIFKLVVDIGTYSTSVHVNNPYYNAVPASINSTFGNYFNTDSISFAIQPIPGMKDLTISMIPLTPARLGLSDVYKIYYKNVGTTNISNGEIIFKHDSRLSFTSAFPSINSSNGDTLKWNYSNLGSLDTGSITIYLQVQTPTAVNIGDTISSIAMIDPVSGDVTPDDDTTRLRQVVIGPYDPNNKYESNEGVIDPSYVSHNKYLNYLIRFQNVGNDTAFNVIVRDTLDAKLDWNTFEMVGASHSYQVGITNQNKIEWIFSNIQLPGSNTNEPASHGFIAYRVKPKSTVAVGDTIHNDASIYFDFNLPLETNNAFTVVETDIILPVHLLNFSGVYRNAHTLLYWSTVNEDDFEKFEIERGSNGINYASVGIKKSSGGMGVTYYQFDDDLSNVPGKIFYYRLKMIDKDGRISYSKVILIRKDWRNTDIISITPNPVRKDQAIVSMFSTRHGIIDLNIIDLNGRNVLHQRNNIFEGSNTITLNNLTRLPSGLYALEIVEGGDKIITKFVIGR